MSRTSCFSQLGRAPLVGALALLLAVCFAAPARAEFIGSVQINFDSGSESGSFQLNLPANLDYYRWTLAAPVNVYSSENPANLLATINGFSVELDGDPGVSLGFAVSAAAVDTHITVTSSTVSFVPLVNPLAFATAAITVTDDDSSPSGATVTGLFPGSLAYRATYNGATTFADLVAPVSAATDSSAIGSGRFPLAGLTVIAGAVSSISSQFDFMLSANDSASGTSRFNVVPEPSSLALALVGFVGLAWQLRRRR
jgi:hypothetical protein